MLSQTKTVFVYQLKDKSFYKHHNKGSWAVSLGEVTRRDITTKDLSEATHFQREPDRQPYLHRCMHGGKWVQVKITTTYEVQDEK